MHLAAVGGSPRGPAIAAGVRLDGMRIPRLHAWPRTPRAAIALQRVLAARVLIAPPRDSDAAPPRFVAAVDAAFSPDGRQIVAGVVLWDAERRATIEQHVVRRVLTFPYVPGLLSFREAPAVLAALRRLRRDPDVVFCDGQGLAHPRRFGLACHVGLWIDCPTVGVAKSRLCGECGEPGPRRCAQSALWLEGEIVGVVLRTRANVAPLFISCGHRCDLEWATRVVLGTTTGYRLPEPARLVHQLVTKARHTPPVMRPTQRGSA